MDGAPQGPVFVGGTLSGLPGHRGLAIVGRARLVAKSAGCLTVKLRGETFLDIASSLAAYWYFHLPNFILAVLMYTLLGRVLLGLMVDADSPNYIWRFFCRITDPVVAAVAIVTPKVTPPVVIWLFGFVWLFWLRVALHYTLLLFNLAPRLGGAAS
jgi:hypothetical protein